MSTQTQFPLVFKKLKSILEPYSSKLIIKTDAADGFSLDGAHSEKWKKELFFGAAQIKKNYVSFHLMPVYMYPDMLKNISPELKKYAGKIMFQFQRDRNIPVR